MNPWQATLKFPSIYNPVRKSFFHSKCNILGNDQYGFNTFNKVSSPFPRTTSTQLFSFSLLCTFFRQFYSFSFIFFLYRLKDIVPSIVIRYHWLSYGRLSIGLRTPFSKAKQRRAGSSINFPVDFFSPTKETFYYSIGCRDGTKHLVGPTRS